MQRLQLFFVGFGRSPLRRKDLHPAFGFQRLQDLEAIVFMADLFQFPAALAIRQQFDNPLALGIFVTHLRFGVEVPPQPRAIAAGPDHQ